MENLLKNMKDQLQITNKQQKYINGSIEFQPWVKSLSGRIGQIISDSLFFKQIPFGKA